MDPQAFPRNKLPKPPNLPTKKYMAYCEAQDEGFIGTLREIQEWLEDRDAEVDAFEYYCLGDKVLVKLEKKLTLVEAA